MNMHWESRGNQQLHFLKPCLKLMYKKVNGLFLLQKGSTLPHDSKNANFAVAGGIGVLGGAVAYMLWPSRGPGPSSNPPETLVLTDEKPETKEVMSEDIQFDSRQQGPRHEDQENQEEQIKNSFEEAEEAAHDKDSQTPQIVDSNKVLSSIQDVLQKDAYQILKEDEEKVNKMDNNQRDHDSSAAVASNGGQVQDQYPKDEERYDESAEVGAAQAALESALADSTGQEMVSHVAKSLPMKIPASKDTSEDRLSRETFSNGQFADNNKMIKDLYEDLRQLRNKLSASGLIAAAVSQRKKLCGDGEVDWKLFPARHQQAEADARTFVDAVDNLSRSLQQAIETAGATAEAALLDAEKARKEMEELSARLKQKMYDTLKSEQIKYNKQLNEQKKMLVAQYTQLTINERKERQEKIDDLRIQLDALQEALRRRSEAAAESQKSHKLSKGAFSLMNALKLGRSLDETVQYIQKTSGDDSLVMAAISTLPRRSPVPTVLELLEEFLEVERVAIELSYLPNRKGGMLSAAAAKTFGNLKIREPASLNKLHRGNNLVKDSETIESDLSYAKICMHNGKLLEAAEIVERAVKGTAATHAVQDWVEKVKVRATVEQVAKLLEAHASAISFSQITTL